MNQFTLIRFRRSFFLAVLMVVASAPFAIAKEDPKVFLHALQDNGYGELAADYLASLQERGLWKDDDENRIEIESAVNAFVASQETGDPVEAVKRLQKAESLLGDFLKKNTKGLLAARATFQCGNIEFERGQRLLKAAGKEKTDSFCRESRAAYEKARARYADAIVLYEKILAPSEEDSKGKMPWEQKGSQKESQKSTQKAASSKPSKQELEVRNATAECRFKQAMVDYQIAQTYAAFDDPDRRKALIRAAASFDAVFQRNRLRRIGLIAHYWQAKTLVEAGDYSNAIEVIDEVLAGAPENEKDERPEPALESLYAEAERCRLTILAARNDFDLLVKEAEPWLEANKPAQYTDGYQGVRLELAKALLRLGEKKKNAEKTKRGLDCLAELIKTPSPYQQEAMRLYKSTSGKGADLETSKYEDAIAIGNASASNGLWDEAIKAYQKAVEFARKDADDGKIATALYRLARVQFGADRVEESLKTAESLAHDYPRESVAPSAAALAIHAAATLTTNAKDKKPAQEKLDRLVDFITQQWPDLPEADEGRIYQAQVIATDGDYKLALKKLDGIRPTSKRYIDARYFAGQIARQRYLDEKKKLGEKKKPDENGDADAVDALRQSTIDILSTAIKTPAPDKESEKEQADTRSRMKILLAEMYLEEKNGAGAMELLGPLLEKSEDRSVMSASTASMALGDAVKAYWVLDDLSAAAAAAKRLSEVGEDSPPINAVLAEMLKKLNAELRQRGSMLQPDIPDAKKSGGSEGSRSVAETRQLIAVRDAILQEWLKRKNHSLAGESIVADVCQELGKTIEAQVLYKDIAAKAKKGPKPREKRLCRRCQGAHATDHLPPGRKKIRASPEGSERTDQTESKIVRRAL